MLNSKLILLVEDDKDIMRLNSGLFRHEGYRVLESETVTSAVEILKRERPDLVVLDIMLPDGNGLELCRRLRRENAEPPILFLSAKRQPTEIVEGLKAGGDGYLAKPYDLNVLLANAEALLRRADMLTEKLTRGALTLDIVASVAYLNGKDMLLAQKEFALLLLFVQNPDKAMSAEYLYEKAWKSPMVGDDSAVKNMVYRLRKKLVPAGMDIKFLRNEGYVFSWKPE